MYELMLDWLDGLDRDDLVWVFEQAEAHSYGAFDFIDFDDRDEWLDFEKPDLARYMANNADFRFAMVGE